ncbi:hypothetical protein CHCC14809_3063 [Bacillus licheniformis]|nr:hypothetical protein B4091_0180 [Bacillus licheniformis]TWJ43898.1 hypothetical protein CHCC5026_1703 [Bacillus licheniformis]TWK92281.1 hypothetical protein CHCC20327_1732 [Bacillus licheniformis]TWM80076.1 hypothetical protein CHCC14809_3063 [Bacillus licheniformis]
MSDLKNPLIGFFFIKERRGKTVDTSSFYCSRSGASETKQKKV